MLRTSIACIMTLLLVAAASAETPPKAYPNLQGRWRLVALIQDEHTASEAQLKGAYVDITDELMVFHVPSKPDYPDLHVKYTFVPAGIDLQITDSRNPGDDGSPARGAWTRKKGLFRFAFFATDGVSVRPPVAPAKSVIYVELKRDRGRQ